YKSQLLTPGMSIPVDRYIQYAPKDFFYVMVHDPTPRPVEVDAASPWTADGGTQPPPHWMPGLWKAHIDGPRGPTELLDVEPERATWRIRAGAKEAPASRPARELEGDASRGVLLAATLGFAPEKHPLGFATDGRLAVSIHGGADSGALVAAADGKLSIVRADDATVADRSDLVELPLVVYDGHPVAAPSAPSSPVELRSALGITLAGRVLIARGSFSGFEPLAEALLHAGCDRAVALDRGGHTTAAIDRAGTARPPLAHYDESVLYALGAPLHPRGFRFDPTNPVAPPPPRK
ncbi:MAG: phosphodiester glycosidase family protein, partial [Polyangiaceae bacterium]